MSIFYTKKLSLVNYRPWNDLSMYKSYAIT